MVQMLAIVNGKGGVGKTTTAVNVAAILSVIDTQPALESMPSLPAPLDLAALIDAVFYL
nr:AAA family ATPase [Spirulina major]